MPAPNRALAFVLRVGLFAVFAYAGFEKWHNSRYFVEQIANYQFFPNGSPWVALLLPPLELAAACSVMLLSRAWRQAGAVLMLVMLLMFTGAMVRAWTLGINIECGCFGKGSPTIGPLSFLRNASLMAGTLVLLWFDRETTAKGIQT